MLGEMDAYLIVSKRSAFTHCDPLAQETVIHTNGENVQDTAAAAAAAASQWSKREKGMSKERRGKKRGESSRGEFRERNTEWRR